MFLGHPRVHTPKDISIGSAFCAVLAVMIKLATSTKLITIISAFIINQGPILVFAINPKSSTDE